VGSILNKIPGVISATVDHMRGEARVEVVRNVVPVDEMLAALKPSGYGLIPKAA
jgi:copper chaperone CopZ